MILRSTITPPRSPVPAIDGDKRVWAWGTPASGALGNGVRDGDVVDHPIETADGLRADSRRRGLGLLAGGRFGHRVGLGQELLRPTRHRRHDAADCTGRRDDDRGPDGMPHRLRTGGRRIGLQPRLRNDVRLHRDDYSRTLDRVERRRLPPGGIAVRVTRRATRHASARKTLRVMLLSTLLLAAHGWTHLSDPLTVSPETR